MTEKEYALDMEIVPYSIVNLNTGDSYPIEDEGIFETVVDLLNEKSETIKELVEMDKETAIEVEHINNIYNKIGFNGIIEYAKEKLACYGAVREVDKGLWLMATGGWSDNEFWLDCLNQWNCIFSSKHLRATTPGGGFYYSETPYADITIRLEKGRFELRETDNAIIDLRGDFPPIMIASNTVDDGSEPNCADTRRVLHLLNELADNNPNEERHWYLKKMLDKAWTQYHEQKEENEQLKSEIENNIASFKTNSRKRLELEETNKDLKQYKQAVSDILWDWYRKDGSMILWSIMKELNVDGDVE